MQVPNSVIHLKLATGVGYGPLYVPAYFEKIIRRAYQGRLDPNTPGKGLEITPYPENGDVCMRYREVFSVEGERAALRKLYHFDKNGFIADALTDEEMTAEIEKVMVAEAHRLTRNAKPPEVILPNKSFVDAGCTSDQAVALQTAGYANRGMCVGQSIMDLNAIPGITLDLALKLIAEDKFDVKKVAVKAE